MDWSAIEREIQHQAEQLDEAGRAPRSVVLGESEYRSMTDRNGAQEVLLVRIRQGIVKLAVFQKGVPSEVTVSDEPLPI